MLDVDFLKLAWLAWLAYDGDAFAACRAFERFESTRNINRLNLRRILGEGFDISERTGAWLVGSRRLPLSQFVAEVACADGQIPADISDGWFRPVLIRRSHL